jgi:carboxyl-terminal processing protease
MKTLPFSKIRTLTFGIAVAILIFGIGYTFGEKHIGQKQSTVAATVTNTQTPSSAQVDFSLFWDVWQRLHLYYIDAKTLDTQKLVYGAISGMVDAAGDPYTTFFPPDENKAFEEDISGTFQGIGAQLELIDNKIIIQTPLKGTPAEKAGLKPMDWIVKVNNEETTGWTTTQAAAKIKGKKGTSVTLTILHENATKTVDITIVRDDIIVASVDSWVKKPTDITEISNATGSAALVGSNQSIAYIALSRFGDRTNDEWIKAVDTVVQAEKTQNIKGLVFDLRNNPGGYLDGAVFVASEFIKNGVIVTQTNSDGTQNALSVNRQGKLNDIPMVVLINKGSASAAEIVAGALKDHKRATIVGETSFGKGSVQTPQELTGGASLHVTTGKWLLPSGEWINKKGITPDVEVKSDLITSATTDAQLEKAIEILLK